MIVLAFIVMNTLTIIGLVSPKKEVKLAVDTSAAAQASVATPVIEFTLDPVSVPLGSSSAFQWSVTGVKPVCTASSTLDGPWKGEKTQYGAESTGKLTKEGDFEFILTCKNEGGSTVAKAKVSVSKNNVASASAGATKAASTSTPSAGAKVYCNNRTPCYGPRDVAAHGSAGNCWGWNLDQVFNITNLDKSYHVNKSGISTIEVSSVCGKDLAAALNGTAAAGGGQTRNHLTTTKINASANTSPYFVGYFDSSK
jgi:hypothetical protein